MKNLKERKSLLIIFVLLFSTLLLSFLLLKNGDSASVLADEWRPEDNLVNSTLYKPWEEDDTNYNFVIVML